jgi:hypothetical protein
MGILLVVIAALAVFAIAAATVGTVTARLAAQPPATILKVDQATEWIADRLPFEVAAQLSHDDVTRILRWHLDYFDEIGLASEFGEELAGEVVPVDHAPVVAEDDASVDYVVQRAMADGAEVTPLQVVVVLDLQMRYLEEIGAIGPRAIEGPDSP